MAGQQLAHNDGRPDEEESKLNTVDEGDNEGTSNYGGATTDEKYSVNHSLQQQQHMGAIQTGQFQPSVSTTNDPTANIPIRVNSH